MAWVPKWLGMWWAASVPSSRKTFMVALASRVCRILDKLPLVPAGCDLYSTTLRSECNSASPSQAVLPTYWLLSPKKALSTCSSVTRKRSPRRTLPSGPTFGLDSSSSSLDWPSPSEQRTGYQGESPDKEDGSQMAASWSSICSWLMIGLYWGPASCDKCKMRKMHSHNAKCILYIWDPPLEIHY